MPYLQLDLNGFSTQQEKKRLAAALSKTYSRMMSVDVRWITIVIHNLSEGAIWRTSQKGELEPASVLMLDIRRGRTPELRLELAKALCADCAKILRRPEDHFSVVFTQHAGDEMYHANLGGYSPEWKPPDG